MRRVIVTGASGFIGRHCLPLLNASKWEIHAVSHKIIPDHDKITEIGIWHHVNLFDMEQVSRLLSVVNPTHLLHLAWVTRPGEYWTSIENFKWVQTSLDILQKFIELGGQRFVSSGTCAEYDWNYGYCRENLTPLTPSTPYGICKKSLFELSQSLAQQTGTSAAWARIFFVYGPYEYQNRLIPSVIKALLKQESANCSHGKQIRDFLFVKDVANALIQLLTSQVVGAVNIGSGHPVPLDAIIFKIGEKIGMPDLIHLGAPPSPTNEANFVVADTSRLRNELHWYPDYSLDTGLNETIGWHKNQLSSRD